MPTEATTPAAAAPAEAPASTETVDTAPAEKVEAKPPKESEGWKKILSREAKARQVSDAAKAEKAAVEAEKAAWAKERADQLKRIDAYEAALKKAKEDPLGVLEPLGLKPDDIGRAKLNGGKPPTETQLQLLNQKLQTLEEQQAAKETARLEAEKAALEQQEQRAVAEHFARAVAEAEGKAEKFPILASLKQGSLLRPVVEEHFQKTGKVLSVDEAAGIVEQRLTEEITKGLDSLAARPAGAAMLRKALGLDKPKAPVTSKQPAKTISNLPGTVAPLTKPATRASGNDAWLAFRERMIQQHEE